MGFNVIFVLFKLQGLFDNYGNENEVFQQMAPVTD